MAIATCIQLLRKRKYIILLVSFVVILSLIGGLFFIINSRTNTSGTTAVYTSRTYKFSLHYPIYWNLATYTAPGNLSHYKTYTAAEGYKSSYYFLLTISKTKDSASMSQGVTVAIYPGLSNVAAYINTVYQGCYTNPQCNSFKSAKSIQVNGKSATIYTLASAYMPVRKITVLTNKNALFVVSLEERTPPSKDGHFYTQILHSFSFE